MQEVYDPQNQLPQPTFPINVSETTPVFLELVTTDLKDYQMLAHHQADQWISSHRAQAHASHQTVITHSNAVIHMLDRIARNNHSCSPLIQDCIRTAQQISAQCSSHLQQNDPDFDTAIAQLDHAASYSAITMIRCIQQIAAHHFERFTHPETPDQHRPLHYLLYKNNAYMMATIGDDLFENTHNPVPELAVLMAPYSETDLDIAEFQIDNHDLILSRNPPVYSQTVTEFNAQEVADEAISLLHEGNHTNSVTTAWNESPHVITAYILDGTIHAKYADEPYFAGATIEIAVDHMDQLKFTNQLIETDYIDPTPELMESFNKEIKHAITITDARLKAGSHCASDQQIADFLNDVAQITRDNISTMEALHAIGNWQYEFEDHILNTWAPTTELVSPEQAKQVVDAAIAAGLSNYLIANIASAMVWKPDPKFPEEYRLPWSQAVPPLRKLAAITRNRNGFDDFLRLLGYEHNHLETQELINELYPEHTAFDHHQAPES